MEFCLDDIVKIIRSPFHGKGDKKINNKLSASIAFAYLWKNFNSLIVLLNNNNIVNNNQSGFRPGDSCVHQLISTTHDIYKVFDAIPLLEVTGAFLDLSKAFDKV